MALHAIDPNEHGPLRSGVIENPREITPIQMKAPDGAFTHNAEQRSENDRLARRGQARLSVELR